MMKLRSRFYFNDNAFASNDIPSYRSRMPLEYVEDCDAEWHYDFSDETVRLYRGRLCQCTWSLRRIQPLKVKHYHCSSRPKVDYDRFRYPRRCVHAARAIRRKLLRWVPRAMTTAIARKFRCAGHVDA